MLELQEEHSAYSEREMIRTRRIGFALAALLAIQPALGFVCQLNCRPAERTSAQNAQHVGGTGCHEEATTEDVARVALLGTPAHSCNHFSAPATAPLVEKLIASGAVIHGQVAFVRLLREPEHRSIQSHDTHAPPGHSAHPTDVL